MKQVKPKGKDLNDNEKSMQKTISILQEQIAALVTLVIGIIPTVMQDEEKKKEITDKINKIKGVEESSDKDNAERRDSDKKETEKDENDKIAGKRKGKISRGMLNYEFNDERRSEGWVSSVVRWYEEENNNNSNSQSKRFKLNNCK